MPSALATAKVNLSLVVGPRRADGNHDVVTVLQRIDLTDRISVEPSTSLSIAGFERDTLVRNALEQLAEAAGVAAGFAARIEKRIPVAAGLGGGSSDAATALRLANMLLPSPLAPAELEGLTTGLGADIPFFLRQGPQLGTGDGSTLSPLEGLPQDYWIVLCIADGDVKESTAAVYDRFDARGGEAGYHTRRAALLDGLDAVRGSGDLGRLPGNDLASSPIAATLLDGGAFRADVTGAGPAVYGLFHDRRDAAAVASALRRAGSTWVCAPCWYG